MYRELMPLRQALRVELRANLPPDLPGLDAEHLLQAYLNQLTLYVGTDVADQTFLFKTKNSSIAMMSSMEVSLCCSAQRLRFSRAERSEASAGSAGWAARVQ